MLESLIDLCEFIRERRKYWLTPILVVLVPIVIVLFLLRLLTVADETSSLPPFNYTLF